MKKVNPFKLKQFRGLNPRHIEILEALGIKNASHMLEEGRTKAKREALSQKSGISEELILEYVKLSDLSRLTGVKGIRARLYYDAGIGSVKELSSWEPEKLRLMVTEYVERTGFDGIPPLPKEVESTIANAKALPIILDC